MPASSSDPQDASDPRGRKLVFVVTEDWFFASHFLPMARAAQEQGFAVRVVCRVRDHRDAIEATGAKVIALEAERRSLNPMAAGYAAGQLASILKAERADIIHCIALKPILVGGFAAMLAGVERRIFALTGLGFLGARTDIVGRLAQRAIRVLVRGLATAKTHFLFENPDDPKRLGLDPAAANVTIVGGAGVDPEHFAPAPLPSQPPLKIALVARMLWSKGIDLAVEGVMLARARGAAIELSLYGAPDPSNPKAIPEETLRRWSEEPGIHWHGPTLDVAAIYRAHHVGCLPSRGGEGLPRTLLEAAACGRALVTTDVPGCRALVRDGIEGRIAATPEATALADIFVALASDKDMVARMGAAARLRVISGFTERDVMDAVQRLYRAMLSA